MGKEALEMRKEALYIIKEAFCARVFIRDGIKAAVVYSEEHLLKPAGSFIKAFQLKRSDKR